jgi:AraC family transcriptional activator of mar-sox-rob regulon
MHTRIDETRIIHSHEMDELVVCLSDTGRHRIGEEAVEFKRGRTLYLPAGLVHGVLATPEAPGEILFLCFTHAELTNLMPGPLEAVVGELRNEQRYASPSPNESAIKLTQSALEELSHPSGTSQAMAGSLLSQVLLLHARSFTPPEGAMNRNEAKIAACCRLIHARPRDAFRLDDLARDSGICRTLFCRLFKQQTGLSLSKYILNVRVHTAMELLAGSDLPITRVAQECGFTNLSHFHREFKKLTQMTPRHYRVAAQEQGALPRAPLQEERLGA